VGQIEPPTKATRAEKGRPTAQVVMGCRLVGVSNWGRCLIRSAVAVVSPRIFTNTGATANHNKTDKQDKADNGDKTDPGMLNAARRGTVLPQ